MIDAPDFNKRTPDDTEVKYAYVLSAQYAPLNPDGSFDPSEAEDEVPYELEDASGSTVYADESGQPWVWGWSGEEHGGFWQKPLGPFESSALPDGRPIIHS